MKPKIYLTAIILLLASWQAYSQQSAKKVSAGTKAVSAEQKDTVQKPHTSKSVSATRKDPAVFAALGARRITLTAAGLERTAMYFKPSKPGKGEAPLVIVLHGHSGNGADFAAKTDFPALWPEATIIYPDGLPAPGGHDPEGETPGWQHNIGELGDRDLLLFDEILKFVSKERSSRPAKVYVAGFSNGARMTYLLWSARSQAISAVAICAGNSKTNDLDKSLAPKPAVLNPWQG
jgi:poly(3-hydroxybutyrate) depolymerase